MQPNYIRYSDDVKVRQFNAEDTINEIIETMQRESTGVIGAKPLSRFLGIEPPAELLHAFLVGEIAAGWAFYRNPYPRLGRGREPLAMPWMYQPKAQDSQQISLSAATSNRPRRRRAHRRAGRYTHAKAQPTMTMKRG
ncbi:MAG TPA: hypothetical protein VKB96_05355 [Gammaproteobacteria bacterium]|nr:hypothetical protein [Gammaproteobacteria bacterium]